jgi:hypothetical protein
LNLKNELLGGVKNNPRNIQTTTNQQDHFQNSYVDTNQNSYVDISESSNESSNT